MNNLLDSHPGSAWVDDKDDTHHLEPTYSVDMANVIDGPPDPQDETLENVAARELLVRIFQIVMVARPDSKVNMVAAFRQFCCLTWLVNPGALQNISLRKLAAELQCTPAALDKYVQRLSIQLGIRNPRMKLEGTRDKYREVQLRDHWRRRPKKEAGHPLQGMPGCDLNKQNSHSEAVI